MTALISLASRLRTAKLHLVTDVGPSPEAFSELLLAALRGGVDVVQLRDAQASPERLRSALETARSLTQQVGGLVVVAQRLDVAADFGADVVHLGAADGETADARAAVGRYGLVGRSVHDVLRLHTDADYLFVGPVFGTPLDGLDLVRAAARELPVDSLDATPWVAVGGIDEDTLDEVLAAGALRVAVSGAVITADDPQQAAARIKQRLQAAWDARPAMEGYVLGAVGGGTATFVEQGDETDEQRP